MGVSMIKSWLPAPSTGSALPNSREDQRGSVTLLSLSRPHLHSQYTDDDGEDWLRRSNWPRGHHQSITKQLSCRCTLPHTAHYFKQ
jgi:hypothetical protein